MEGCAEWWGAQSYQHACKRGSAARGRGLAGYPPTGAAGGADLSLFGATCARWWARERVGRLLA
jgi:hypothetical protein